MDVQWMTFLDSEGRVMDPRALKKRIFYGGVEQKLRHVVFSWSLFAGFFSNWQIDLDQISEYLSPLFCWYIGSSWQVDSHSNRQQHFTVCWQLEL